MKITEIRIGNCFEYKGSIINFAIEDFTEADNNSQFLELINPIPLTEQWLKDFNYNNEDGYWYNKDKSYRIHEISNIWVIESHYIKFQNKEKLISEWVFITDFQYVHQLQNLYWCLCEKELKKKS